MQKGDTSIIKTPVADPRWFHNTKNIFVGTFAGITSTLIGHPFDTVKVRVQVQSPGSKVYQGPFDCLLKTLKWEGIGGLFKGVGSPLAGQIFMRTALFTSYYESLEYMSNGQKLTRLDLHKYYIAGMICGTAGGFIDTPLDLFKSKLQIQIMKEKLNQPIAYRYKNVFDCARYIIQTYGIKGGLQGLTPTILRNAFGYSAYFTCFEFLKRKLKSNNETLEKLNASTILLSGGISGILFWTLTYNIDVVKSAMMADALVKDERLYKNTLDCLLKLYQTEGGYKRLWKGYLPCLLRSVPVNASMLFVVESTRKYLPTYQQIFG